MTTNNSAGMLSVNCYETKAGNPKPVDFARFAQTEEEFSSGQSSSPEVLICEGTIVCARKGSQSQIQPTPFWPDLIITCMYTVENPAVMATYCAQDTLLPFQLLKQLQLLNLRQPVF